MANTQARSQDSHKIIFVRVTKVHFPPIQGSLYYQPKQCTIQGKSFKITTDLHCFNLRKLGNLITLLYFSIFTVVNFTLNDPNLNHRYAATPATVAALKDGDEAVEGAENLAVFMCAIGSINSHYCHIIGDSHQPNRRVLYTYYKDALLMVG